MVFWEGWVIVVVGRTVSHRLGKGWGEEIMESEVVHLPIVPPINVMSSHTIIKTQDNTELETQKLGNIIFT